MIFYQFISIVAYYYYVSESLFLLWYVHQWSSQCKVKRFYIFRKEEKEAERLNIIIIIDVIIIIEKPQTSIEQAEQGRSQGLINFIFWKAYMNQTGIEDHGFQQQSFSNAAY